MKPLSIANRKIFFNAICYFMIVAILNLTVSCSYYKVNKVRNLNEDKSKVEVEKYRNLNKYFILHTGNEMWHVSIQNINAENKTMEVKLESVSAKHKLYLPNATNSTRIHEGRGGRAVLNEVHILTSQYVDTHDSIATINFSSITRIDIIEMDTWKNIGTFVFTATTVAVAAYVISLIIIILTKSSCPFVYAHDGTGYNFKGEIYGGAIFKPLERDDYMHLQNLSTDATNFKMKITNELLEVQYTNLVKAMLVEHNKNENILIDSKGEIHSIKSTESPLSAVMNDTENMMTQLAAIDSNLCMFDGENNNHNVNDLVLKFAKPAKAQETKLVVRAKNSLWLDYAFGEFTKLFGSYYNKFVEKQRTANHDSLLNWTVKQGLPLSVYLKQNGQWKLIEHIPTVGPLASRDFCIPIDVSQINTPDMEIKISCGFMFWEVDYAGIDFSEDENIKTTEMELQSAIDENNIDVKSLITENDKNYLIQPKPGNTVEFIYKLPAMKNEKAYDVFLQTKGYYEHVRNYKGLPNKKYLTSMKEEGAFIDFTKSLFDKIKNDAGLTTSK